MLYPANFYDRGAEFNSWSSNAFNWDEFLFLVCVNTSPQPRYYKGPLVDKVELFFMGKGGALCATGTKAAADVIITHEAL